jgi:hypothetical protein
MLYSLNGQYPTEKPFRIRMTDGSTRTAEAVTEETLSEAGYTQVLDKPEETLYQTPVWNGTTWVMTDKVVVVRLVDGVVVEQEWENLQNQKSYGDDWKKFTFRDITSGKNYPHIGYTYDSENDVYISPKPYRSWTLNESFDWEAPVSKPTDWVSDENPNGKRYTWNESTTSWDEIVIPE